MEHPIDNIVWIEVERLQANDYNPNMVLTPELRLLEHSLIMNGWIQPVLVGRTGEELVIIDGFHRWSLAKDSKKVREMTQGKVPCAVLDLTIPERMMLTVRINRAKGNHSALKMHDLVASLITDHGLSAQDVMKGIGATKDEVDLLMQENVFTKLKIPDHQYSKAWYPL